MLSTFSNLGSIITKKTKYAPSVPQPILTQYSANANGLNSFAVPVTLDQSSCISNDGQRIVIMSSNSNTNPGPRYSFDGGASWQTCIFSPPLPDSIDCWGLCSNSTNQYIMFIGTQNPSYAYKSIDYGQTFTQWTSSNFGGLAVTVSKWQGAVSEDGTTWIFSSNNSAMNGVFLCSNGSSTQANDIFVRHLAGFQCFGATCSPDGNYLFATTNTGTYRHWYSLNKGVSWTNSTLTISGSTIQNQPLISSDGKRMWSIIYSGSTAVSNFLDLNVSTTWNVNYGASQWLSSYCLGTPNLGDTDCSSSMKLMALTMTNGTAATSNNVFYSVDYGVTWARMGSLFSDLTSVKINKLSCSKNGKFMLLVGNNNILYKVEFPTENV